MLIIYVASCLMFLTAQKFLIYFDKIKVFLVFSVGSFMLFAALLRYNYHYQPVTYTHKKDVIRIDNRFFDSLFVFQFSWPIDFNNDFNIEYALHHSH